MKYKLKFEVVYTGMDKGVIRDMKLENILSANTQTEITSDSPITPPSKSDIVLLNDIEHTIVNIKHKLDSESYTIIVNVENREIRERVEKEKRAREMKNMINTFSNII